MGEYFTQHSFIVIGGWDAVDFLPNFQEEKGAGVYYILVCTGLWTTLELWKSSCGKAPTKWKPSLTAAISRLAHFHSHLSLPDAWMAAGNTSEDQDVSHWRGTPDLLDYVTTHTYALRHGSWWNAGAEREFRRVYTSRQMVFSIYLLYYCSLESMGCILSLLSGNVAPSSVPSPLRHHGKASYR